MHGSALHLLSSREPQGFRGAREEGAPGVSLASHRLEDEAEGRGRKPGGEKPVVSRNGAGFSPPLREQTDRSLNFLGDFQANKCWC